MTDAAAPPALPPLRTLGRTGARVPPLGFGVSGPLATPLMTDRDVVALVRRAVELGVAVFDTAPFYGFGLAERRLGRAIAGVERARLFLITKAGTRQAGGKCFAPAYLRSSLDASLRRLGVDAMDALLLHGLPGEHETDAVLAELAQLKDAGRVRFIGVCVGRPEMARALALEDARIDLLMAPAPADPDEEAARLWAEARAQGLGLLGIDTFAPSRPRRPRLERLSDLFYVAQTLRRSLSRPAGSSSSQSAKPHAAALREALASGCADVTMITTRRPSHLEANVALAWAEAGRLDAAGGGA